MSGCNESGPGHPPWPSLACQQHGGHDLLKVWVLPSLTQGGRGAAGNAVWRQGLSFSLP